MAGDGGSQLAGNGLHALRGRRQVDQVEAVLDEPKPEPIPDQRRPVIGMGPALDREAGVDAELQAHRSGRLPDDAAAASSRQAPKRSS